VNLMTRLVTFLALGFSAASGQDIISNGPSAAGFAKSVHFGGQPGMSTPVTGAPYSGEVVTENLQTLADGTHIRLAMIPTKVFRDSSGRTREERPLFGGAVEKAPPGAESLMIIEISDPVARVRYVLDSHEKVAHKQALFVAERAAAYRTATNGNASSAAPAATHPAPVTQAIPRNVSQTATEKLEPQEMEGVLAEGTRTTTTWPEGSQGNDRPIVAIVESWRSKELQIPVLIKTFDPRSGEHVVKLTNVSRSTPDSSLFQPPPDYTVVEEKEDFTIKYGPIPW
jgi:hypothetical protein